MARTMQSWNVSNVEYSRLRLLINIMDRLFFSGRSSEIAALRKYALNIALTRVCTPVLATKIANHYAMRWEESQHDWRLRYDVAHNDAVNQCYIEFAYFIAENYLGQYSSPLGAAYSLLFPTLNIFDNLQGRSIYDYPLDDILICGAERNGFLVVSDCLKQVLHQDSLRPIFLHSCFKNSFNSKFAPLSTYDISLLRQKHPLLDRCVHYWRRLGKKINQVKVDHRFPQEFHDNIQMILSSIQSVVDIKHQFKRSIHKYLRSLQPSSLDRMDLLRTRAVAHDHRQGFQSDSLSSESSDEEGGAMLKSKMLVLAARNNDIACSRALIDSGADVNSVVYYRDLEANHSYGIQLATTPLLEAARGGHNRLCQLLIGLEADPSFANVAMAFETPLMVAAQNGNLALCRLLVQSEVPINCARYNAETALTLAAQKGHLEVCQFLVENGANINQITTCGSHLPILAARSGNQVLCEWVESLGFNLNKVNQLGETALSLAVEYGSTSAVRRLVDSGADPAQVLNKKNHTVLDIAERCGVRAIQHALKGSEEMSTLIIASNSTLFKKQEPQSEITFPLAETNSPR